MGKARVLKNEKKEILALKIAWCWTFLSLTPFSSWQLFDIWDKYKWKHFQQTSTDQKDGLLTNEFSLFREYFLRDKDLD